MRILVKRVVVLAISCFTYSTLSATPGDTYRAGNKVIGPNDSQARLLDAMGDPDTKEPVDNKYGAHVGEYWYYNQGRKTVKFFLSGGKVIDIEEIRN